MSEINHNQIKKECKVKDIPKSLNYIDTGRYDTFEFLERMGIELRDIYSVWYGKSNTGDFEIYVSHHMTPYLNGRAYKIDISEINQYEVSMYL